MRMFIRRFMLALLVAGCAAGSDDRPAAVTSAPAPPTSDAGRDAAALPPVPSASGALPCDVARVLGTRCQGCHGKPPLYGAPMPLATWADTQAVPPGDTVPAWKAI